MEYQYIFLYIFIAITVFHLVSLFFKRRIIHAASKSLLMPALLAIYVFSANIIYWPVIAALIFGCMGDVFLLNIKNPLRFKLGLGSFLLGHIAYIIALINYASPINMPALIISIVIAIAFCLIMYRIVHPNAEMRVPVVIYETVIMAMAISAFQVFLNIGHPIGTLVFAGSLFFVMSDSFLARFTFVRMIKYGQFIVMITYIAAQFLIVLGFCRI